MDRDKKALEKKDKEALAKKKEEVLVQRKPIGLLIDMDFTLYAQNSNNQVYEALTLIKPEKWDRIEPQLTKKEIDSETRDFLNSIFCEIDGTLKHRFYHDRLNQFMPNLNAENHVSIITATSYPAATLFLFQKAGFGELIQFENIHTVPNIINDKIPILKSEKVLEIVIEQNLQAVVFVDDNMKTCEEVKKLDGIDIQIDGKFQLMVETVHAGEDKLKQPKRTFGDPEIFNEMMGCIEQIHYNFHHKLEKLASASAPFLFSEQPTGEGDTTSLSKGNAVEISRGGPGRGTFYENNVVVNLQELELIEGQPKQLDLESGKSASASAPFLFSEQPTDKGDTTSLSRRSAVKITKKGKKRGTVPRKEILDSLQEYGLLGQPTDEESITSLSKGNAVEIFRGGPGRGTVYENIAVVKLQELELIEGQSKQLDLESGESASASVLPPGSEGITGKEKKIVALTMVDVGKKPLTQNQKDHLAYLQENMGDNDKLSGFREAKNERIPAKKSNHEGEQTQGAAKSTKSVPADRHGKKRP
ncbi:hypothetical protein OAC51_07560 [Flavobacteriaceae bacterium]|nr:hypothetical protein [Flavobacteriaceae bacterium]